MAEFDYDFFKGNSYLIRYMLCECGYSARPIDKLN